MIAIRRGTEPLALAEVRERELNRIFTLAEARPPGMHDIGAAYGVAREELWEAQHMKCCYCEQHIPIESQPVEHIRPKTAANRVPGSTLKEGYWWLAWTWENLLFACHACNTKKSTNWPLATGEVLPRGAQPPGSEVPLFIDPSRENPLDLIQFVDAQGKWGPIERDTDERARRTLQILGFSRIDHSIRALYNKHVKDFVRPAAQKITAADLTDDESAVRRLWDEAVEVLVMPTQRFSALSRAALPALVGTRIISRWGLALPPPVLPADSAR